jgi:hypothetical protein
VGDTCIHSSKSQVKHTAEHIGSHSYHQAKTTDDYDDDDTVTMTSWPWTFQRWHSKFESRSGHVYRRFCVLFNVGGGLPIVVLSKESCRFYK